MADFEISIKKTLANEGGDKYTETEGDSGGATKYGISLRFLTDILETKSGQSFFNATFYYPILPRHDRKVIIQTLTLNQAKEIYRVFFWDANRYGEIEDQSIAEKVFDMAVLMGAPRANRCLQRSLFEDGYGEESDIDGIIGPMTIGMIDLAIATEYIIDLQQILKCNFTKHFISLCNKDKSQSKFLLGWLNRVMS